MDRLAAQRGWRESQSAWRPQKRRKAAVSTRWVVASLEMAASRSHRRCGPIKIQRDVLVAKSATRSTWNPQAVASEAAAVAPGTTPGNDNRMNHGVIGELGK